VYRRISGPVYDNEKENWRILTSKEIHARVKTPTITETVRLNRLCWFGHVQRMEEAPENGKESSHSARANGMNERSVYKFIK
jgi:hypothetical protein